MQARDFATTQVRPAVAMCGLLAILAINFAMSDAARAFGNTIDVTTTADNLVHDSECSLREAITNVNDNAPTYTECVYGAGNLTIGFATGLGSATIVLASQLPEITHTGGLAIDGGGHIAISANNAWGRRVFKVAAGTTLTLRNLTITGGQATTECSSVDDGQGGGVHNQGTLNIESCTFVGNSATGMNACTGNGGALYNAGTMSVVNSVFSNNSTKGYGGAILNSGTATITGSTFLNNAAQGGYGGGAIFNFGTLIVANSTFAQNTVIAYSRGGGLYNHTGTATLINNTFAFNSATTGSDIYNSNVPGSATLNLYNNILANGLDGGNCVSNGGTINAGNNLIESTGSDACGLVNSINGNIIGSDPQLSSIYASAYFPLLPSSPAIDKADDARCQAAPVSAKSQNGLTRPQGAHCDIGAYEGDYTPPTIVSSVRADANPTNASTVHFTVTFSEPVAGVDAADFTLTTTGSISGATVTNATGSGTTTTVTVSTGTGVGTLRLDIIDNDTIVDAYSNPLGGVGVGIGNYTAGEAYTIVYVGAPTISHIAAGPGSATIDFTPPTETGGSPITGYTASCAATGQTTRTATASASPITVRHLSGGIAYQCTIKATNGAGLIGTASAAQLVTPTAAAKKGVILPMLLLD